MAGNKGPQFILNAQGFPIVSGTYGVSLGKLTNNCGASEEPAQFLGNVVVTQSGDSITMELTNQNTDALEAAGWTIINQSFMSGTVSKDGKFVATSGATLNHVTFGTLYINWATNGTFTPTGASGTYGFSTIYDDLGFSCTYTASLTASKV